MITFQRYFLLVVILLWMAGCKPNKKKTSLSGEDPVATADFIDFFQPLTLTFEAGDTLLQQKENDSLRISYKVFTELVPDSVISKVFGKGVKPAIYPLGKVIVPKAETYLFVKANTSETKVIYILCFDSKNQFITGMAALLKDQLSATSQSMTVDKKYALTKTIVKKNTDGSVSDGKDVYALDAAAKKFTLIMTDPLDDKVTELINPIDTLPRTNKMSADYSNGKMNLVSIRDGRKSDRISFFIHIEKNKGECTGEVKGEAMLRGKNLAEYRENGDPCILQFIFTASAVTLKEVEGCGARRGLDCVFDASFAKKKNPKTDDKKNAKK